MTRSTNADLGCFHCLQGWQPPLTSRILFFLLRTHHNQIVATRALRQTMANVRKSLRAALGAQKVSKTSFTHPSHDRLHC